MPSSMIEVLKILVFSSVLFVWVVRYKNIIEEFQFYQYPAWLRDLVGILKVSFVVMLMRENVQLVQLGASGIIVLMAAAFFTHIRVKNPLNKMLPSMTLFMLSALILWGSSR